ncbi:MAG TPA: DUF190 domain-containing protein [bacterium]|nr:DUF190 domain-containing protein [bacterium]
MAKKLEVLRVYLDEQWKWKGNLLYRALVEELRRQGASGATVFRAVEGFGSSVKIREAHILEMSENLPLVLEVAETPAQIRKLWKVLSPFLPAKCLATIHSVRALSPGRPKGR